MTVTDVNNCTSVETFNISNNVDIVEEYVGNCNFESYCGDNHIGSLDRMGDIQVILKNNDAFLCTGERICFDQTLPSGKDILIDNIELGYSFYDGPNNHSNGCKDIQVWCNGPNGIRGGNDDIFLFSCFNSLESVSIFDPDITCYSCHSARICRYQSINGENIESQSYVLEGSITSNIIPSPPPNIWRKWLRLWRRWL